MCIKKLFDKIKKWFVKPVKKKRGRPRKTK